MLDKRGRLDYYLIRYLSNLAVYLTLMDIYFVKMVKGLEDITMFYPLYDLAKIRQDELLESAQSACVLHRAYQSVPTLMDRLLIGLGDVLISLGQKIRSGSAYARALQSGS